MNFARFNSLDYIRHAKTDKTYKVLGRCIYAPTNTECYNYLGEDGTVWTRPAKEMEDGRFELLAHNIGG